MNMNEREYRLMFEAEESHWWYVSLHNLIMDIVAQEAQKGAELKILDAGCGTGRLCQLLQKFGQVDGCDISATALELCRERGLDGLFRADLNSVELGNSRYDVITSIDVLYHLAIEDDSRVVQKFHDALRPGGVLILNLVAHEFLRSAHDTAVHTRKRYCRGDVVAMLEKSGFVVEKATYRLGIIFLPLVMHRLCRRFANRGKAPEAVASDVRPLPPILNSILLFLANCENRLLARFTIPFGTSVFAVARRPK
jgi:2-polyprenyl-3-methyl-5-hydroxy-6-metoxy-1,4-benzoquinol methylase